MNKFVLSKTSGATDWFFKLVGCAADKKCEPALISKCSR
jgi:hypothetical protein